MTIRKNKKADLRRAYGLFVEVGLVAALLLLVLAFRTNIERGDAMDFSVEPPEAIQVAEIPQTEILRKPPPPPRPQVPFPVPDDKILDEEEVVLGPLFVPDGPLTPGDPPAPTDNTKEKEPEPPFFVVEEMPCLLPDNEEPCSIEDNINVNVGLADLQKKIRYPEIARKAGVEGRVILRFVVDEDGHVTEPEILRGIGAGCNEEALRVVREATFKPGKQRGKAVRVKMSLPITFRLK